MYKSYKNYTNHKSYNRGVAIASFTQGIVTGFMGKSKKKKSKPTDKFKNLPPLEMEQERLDYLVNELDEESWASNVNDDIDFTELK